MNEVQQAAQAAQTLSQWSDRAVYLLLLMVVLYGAWRALKYMVERLEKSDASLMALAVSQNSTNEKLAACLANNSACIMENSRTTESNSLILEKVAVELRECRKQRMPPH